MNKRPLAKPYGQSDAVFFCHVNLAASGIYFGSPFGRYPTFHTLKSVGRKKCFQYVKRMFPLFRAIVKFCSTNRLFTYNQLIVQANTSFRFVAMQYTIFLYEYLIFYRASIFLKFLDFESEIILFNYYWVIQGVNLPEDQRKNSNLC